MTTGNIIAFILYHSREFFPVLDRFGCDRDHRGNDNFISIMLEGVRCSKLIKIFSSVWSFTGLQRASRVLFLSFEELFFFLFYPILLNVSSHCNQMYLG